ncbi:uroporphyrinogen-III C-methyltransferase [Agromyces seonyuensis]|nr:uroporphyrinogen-III C-methyltransferase [Agromyces seonyuensis]
MTDPAPALGRATIAGGGPGDDALLTAAALEALRTADVVLYDRLAPHDRLAELAPDAELIDVGKRPGHHPVDQSGINALIVEHARRGAHVVRLKGGDPYVFGRGSEEVLACHAAGIPVVVVPGVTSSIAVPAAAGIPLTHRGITRLFTVVSGHAPLDEDELEHLAKLGGTIVVLMGVNTLPQIAPGLARHGLGAGTPVAIIERGCSPEQRTTIGSLDSIVVDAHTAGVASPAVVVIGEVVRLAYAGDATAAELVDRAERLGATLSTAAT